MRETLVMWFEETCGLYRGLSQVDCGLVPMFVMAAPGWFRYRFGSFPPQCLDFCACTKHRTGPGFKSTVSFLGIWGRGLCRGW
jgi:hypothetical protein